MAGNIGLEPLRSGVIRHWAADAIRDAIFAGRFRPGDSLRELHLAEQLRVSQASVREALLQLEHESLVVRTPHRGTSVTMLSDKEVAERVRLRSELECMAAVEASAPMTAGDFERLEALALRIGDAAARDRHREAAVADLEFHRFIWEKSGNGTLRGVLLQLSAPLFAFISILRSADAGHMVGDAHGHEPLIEALRQGGKRKITEAVRTHIEGSYGHYLGKAHGRSGRGTPETRKAAR